MCAKWRWIMVQRLYFNVTSKRMKKKRKRNVYQCPCLFLERDKYILSVMIRFNKKMVFRPPEYNVYIIK